MTLELIREIAQSAELSQPLTDLDMTKILTAVDPRMNEKTAVQFAERYFTSDALELRERLSALSDLKNLTSAAKLQHAIDSIELMRREAGMASSAVTKLTDVLYHWRLMASYVRTVKEWNDLLNGQTAGNEADFPSAGNDTDSASSSSIAIESSRIGSLRDFFRERVSEPLFKQCEDALQTLDETLPLPRYIHLAMNVKDDGMPVEIGVLRTEGHIDLRQDFRDTAKTETDQELNALISVTDTKSPSCSLGPEFNYNRGLFGSHYDEYLMHNLEHEWKNNISKAAKITDKIKLPALNDILAFTDPMSFYQVGLLCAEAYEDLGYGLCRPDSRENVSLEIRGALYPDFILHHEGIQGNDLLLKKGNAVVITGPNHSGKTSYLKTIGQCYMLAQLGFYVPAGSMVFEPVKNIFTLFSAGEDSSMTASRMGVEVKKLTEILKKATAADLIFLNEPMTSTNPVEAVSICADLSRHFLEVGATHLLVTHLYDIYYLLKAQLAPELLPRMESLITQSYYDEVGGHMVHSYRLIEHEPLGNSYARETATAYGVTLDAMIKDKDLLKEAERYCDEYNKDSVYEGDDSDGISDDN